MQRSTIPDLASNQSVEQQEPERPERNLLAAVLGRAIADFLQPRIIGNYGAGMLKIKNDAYNWITERRTDRKGLSFVYCCNALDLNPTVIRNVIFEYERTGKVWRLEKRKL